MNLNPRLLAAASILTMAVLAACGGGGGGGGATIPSGGGGGGPVATPTPTPSPTPSPSPSPTNTPSGLSTLICKTSGSPQSIAIAAAGPDLPARRMPEISRSDRNGFAPGIIEVVYQSKLLASHRSQAAELVRHVGGDVRSEMDFSSDQIQVVSVEPGTEETAIRELVASGIVKSATRSAARTLQSTTPFLPNDPFYNGFPGNTTPPLYQSAGVGGQWDMHVICAANAWGYGNANTTGTTFAGALGGNVKLAIIDTGADLTRPDLSGGRVVYTETVLSGVVTLTGMHDNDGHGTDVAGIAAATANNSYGFLGVAYATPLMIFRVFPDPPCGTGGCTASGADVGRAITDAVAQGAKVISLSLGSNGPDTLEEAAVAQAIAQGVVVVAASGNGDSSGVGQSTLSFPAADPGVIAVGASSINDSNPANVGESVASYSNYDASNPLLWGLVAPGGDPVSGDPDVLHWIENLYTSTNTTGTVTSAQACNNDPFGGASDCRILIAGTSQATPHVSGAVALLLSVNGLLTPATVKTTLCTTARNISNAKQGCGRLDVYRAMARAVNDLNP